jgi:hypothetical protein
MTALADNTIEFALRRGREGAQGAAAIQRCSLRATEDGWSLLAPSGKIIFRGLGHDSRGECLRQARKLGVLAVTC